MDDDEIDALFEGLEPITPDPEEVAASTGNAAVDPIVMPRSELTATRDLFPIVDFPLLVRRAIKGEERLSSEERQLARAQIAQVNDALQRLAAVTPRASALPACWPEHLEGIWSVELLSHLIRMDNIELNNAPTANNAVSWYDQLTAELRASCSTAHVIPETVPMPSASPYPTARFD
jgi:hypothetical protein